MSISEIIAAMGGNKGAASACRIGETAVSMWRRNGIPSRHWPAIVRAANGAVTYEDLESARPDARAA
jgi:DNA-binding transcriptional regulator YdaS (Cro superfamily)